MCIVVSVCVSLLRRVFVRSCLVFFCCVCVRVGLRILLAGR